MDNRTILIGVGAILGLVAVLSFGAYLERGGLEDLGVVRTGFAQSEIAGHAPGAAPEVQNNRVYRKKVRTQAAQKAGKDFEDLDQELMRFCRYLDGREYIKAYQLPEGTYRYFVKLLNDLATHPPIAAGETSDPQKLKLNQEHFLRVLGRENIDLILEILTQDTEMMESTAQMVFDWLNKGIEAKSPEIKMTRKELYDYAAFFLNTLTGRACLWSRDSKTRILVTYYSILVVDRANREKANLYSVDIKPPIALLMDDLINYRNLSARGSYLRTLKAIEPPASAG